jgi:hypothetical protein
MELDTFQSLVLRFWRYLGLADPVFGSEPEIFLSVDEHEVLLRHGTDGRGLVVEGDAGSIVSGTGLAHATMERLLMTNLALSATRNTLAGLDVGEGRGRARVIVRGYYRYQQDDLGGLSDLVSDVISSVETLNQVLVASQASEFRLAPTTERYRPDGSDLVIFNL